MLKIISGLIGVLLVAAVMSACSHQSISNRVDELENADVSTSGSMPTQGDAADELPSDASGPIDPMSLPVE